MKTHSAYPYLVGAYTNMLEVHLDNQQSWWLGAGMVMAGLWQAKIKGFNYDALHATSYNNHHLIALNMLVEVEKKMVDDGSIKKLDDDTKKLLHRLINEYSSCFKVERD